ncbi:Indoleamine 2,3-dioxygenase [Diplogelasinospora grovesii]|uniref:Indoleamine 2,3-dioxygenase n=1 Tax=Diplogelasinospora grovesii TaxID=303347 RepID=A0AAN6S123_9PEZI|nr:Indoleamine 2,3-dioxygenase [Diplogelasinospora grovesii]
MLPSIPVLADYGLSPTHGFLPDVLPLTRLPDPYYNKWEAIVANLQALILSKRLRGVVDRLPVLSTIGLEHDAEWRRAYSLLTFMAHGYIWGGDSPSDRLPPSIAVPLLQVSEHLEVLPVATYASLCLWNFNPLFVDETIDNLENLATLNTFTGSLDESWFYLVSVAIEARGAPIIPLMLTAIAAARFDDAPTVTRCLQTFAERLDDLGTLLQRMNESCDPTIFYHRIRPFLAGSKNMAEAGLPNGVIYEDGSGKETYRQYSGGSNAQSSIIQFFDIVLGIDHRPTGEKTRTGRASAPRHNFIMDMRRYMPGPHARFLGDVQAVANIREYVDDHCSDTQLCIAYDACLSMLRVLRDKHIAIVTRYIVIPSREVRARSRSRSPEARRRTVNLATASRQSQTSGPQGIAYQADKKRDNLKGTGGTALISFLKQARDETGEPAVEDWARRFMSRQIRAEGKYDFFMGKHEPISPAVGVATEEVQVAGLAGTWTMDDDVGGICHY